MSDEMTRRGFLGAACLASSTGTARASTPEGLVRRIERAVIFKARGGGMAWFHPRVCRIPGHPNPTLFMTCQPMSNSDVFWNLHWSESRDLGVTWSAPVPIEGLGRKKHPGGIEEQVICDASPDHHAKSDKLLVLGDNVYYAADGKTQTRLNGEPWQVPVYLAGGLEGPWSRPQKLEWDYAGASASYNCGCTQRVLLASGDILIPLSYAPNERYSSGPLGSRTGRAEDRAVRTVLCSFDGTRLRIREAGSEFRLPVKRGLLEPSLVLFDGRYYITMRAEDGHGYASASGDGLNWQRMRAWCWEDGESLTMSTTQQHWLRHTEGLFLVYTRKAPANTNVMRWRSPLYMAKVDVELLALIRATERIVLPLIGDGVNQPDQVPRMGNFHAGEVTPELSVVSVGEEMAPEQLGQCNALLARIHWIRPNQLVVN